LNEGEEKETEEEGKIDRDMDGIILFYFIFSVFIVNSTANLC